MQFGELLQRSFQLALADETPGSNDVGYDIDAYQGLLRDQFRGIHVSSLGQLYSQLLSITLTYTRQL